MQERIVWRETPQYSAAICQSVYTASNASKLRSLYWWNYTTGKCSRGFWNYFTSTRLGKKRERNVIWNSNYPSWPQSWKILCTKMPIRTPKYALLCLTVTVYTQTLYEERRLSIMWYLRRSSSLSFDSFTLFISTLGLEYESQIRQSLCPTAHSSMSFKLKHNIQGIL